MSDETMTKAELVAESTVLAEWILTRLIEHKIGQPGYVLHMGLLLATLAHGSAMAEHGFGTAELVKLAAEPEGMARVHELGAWFLERLGEHFTEELHGSD